MARRKIRPVPEWLWKKPENPQHYGIMMLITIIERFINLFGGIYLITYL
jgi:hypothetical protein